MRNARGTLVREGTACRYGRRMKNSVSVDNKKIMFDDVGWIHIAMDPQQAGNISTTSEIMNLTSFERKLVTFLLTSERKPVIWGYK
jgi:hypothetical protein